MFLHSSSLEVRFLTQLTYWFLLLSCFLKRRKADWNGALIHGDIIIIRHLTSRHPFGFRCCQAKKKVLWFGIFNATCYD